MFLLINTTNEVILRNLRKWSKGEAIEIVAKKVGVGKDTLWKAQKIVEKAVQPVQGVQPSHTS